MSLETPECEAHGGSSHARGKRPPAVEINSFSSYRKNTDLRTNIYFAPERLLGYSTDTSWTSRAQEPPTESVVYFRSGMVLRSLHPLRRLKPTIILDGASGCSPSLNVYDMILFYVKKKSYLLTSRRYFPGNNAKFYNFQVGSYFDTV